MGIYGQFNSHIMVRLLVPDCPLDRQTAKQIVRLFLYWCLPPRTRSQRLQPN